MNEPPPAEAARSYNLPDQSEHQKLLCPPYSIILPAMALSAGGVSTWS